MKKLMVRRLFASVLAAVVGFSTMAGCGSGSSPAPSTEQAMKVSGKEELKKRLTSVAETGAGGSGLAGMREAIVDLKASDPAVADQLLQDFVQLEQAQDAEQIKAIAQKMAAKL